MKESIQVEELLKSYYLKSFSNTRDLEALSQKFLRDGYLKLSNLVPTEIKTQLRVETLALLKRYAKRRDANIEHTDYTPRKMSNVVQHDIAQKGRIIPKLYESAELMNFLSLIAKDQLTPCPYEPEKFLITRQEKAGDTHGWHWGDYSYTIIWIVEAPPIENGGMLQCIPHTTWNKSLPRVNEILTQNPIQTYYHSTGDIYFLKSDTTLHRTVPLTRDGLRIIVNMCWASPQEKKKQVNHQTMEEFFT